MGAMGTDLRSLMQLLLETKELGRLAELVGPEQGLRPSKA